MKIKACSPSCTHIIWLCYMLSIPRVCIFLSLFCEKFFIFLQSTSLCLPFYYFFIRFFTFIQHTIFLCFIFLFTLFCEFYEWNEWEREKNVFIRRRDAKRLLTDKYTKKLYSPRYILRYYFHFPHFMLFHLIFSLAFRLAPSLALFSWYSKHHMCLGVSLSPTLHSHSLRRFFLFI
jgi:hypothetical protein